MRTLQRERALVKSLVDLGLRTEQAIELLLHPVYSTSQQSSSSASGVTSRHGSTKTNEDVLEEAKSFSLSPKFVDFLDGLVDASDRPEGGGVVLYWNDLAADARYAQSSSSLQAVRVASAWLIRTSDLNSQLLRVHMMSLFSPMLRIRQNLINVIFVLDLSQTRSLSLLSSLSEHFVNRGYPVRWGIVPDEGEGESKFLNAS